MQPNIDTRSPSSRPWPGRGVAVAWLLGALAAIAALLVSASDAGRREHQRAQLADLLRPVAGAEPGGRRGREGRAGRGRARSRPWRPPQREAQLSGVLAQRRAARRRAPGARSTQTAGPACQGPRAAARRAEGPRPRASSRSTRAARPTTTELLLSAEGFDDLANRAELVGRIEDADASLAGRVRTAPQRGRGAAGPGPAGEGRAGRLQRSGSPPPATRSPRCAPTPRPQAAQLGRRASRSGGVRSVAGLALGASAAGLQQIQAQAGQQAAAAQAQQTVSSWVGAPRRSRRRS